MSLLRYNRMSCAGLLTALALWACEPRNQHIEVPLNEDAHYYWVELGEHDQVVNYSQPTIVLDGELLEGWPLPFPLFDQGQRDTLLAIPHQKIVLPQEKYNQPNFAALRLLKEAPNELLELSQDIDTKKIILDNAPLPEQSILYDVVDQFEAPLQPIADDPLPTNVFKELSMDIPLELETCELADYEMFTKFTSKMEVLEYRDGHRHRGIILIDFIDEDRIIAMARGSLYLLRRGEEYRERPGKNLLSADVLLGPADFSEFKGIGVAPDTFGTSRPRIYVGIKKEPPNAAASYLLEIEIDEEGFRAENLSTTTSTVFPFKNMTNLAVHPDGSLALAFAKDDNHSIPGETVHFTPQGEMTVHPFEAFSGAEERSFVYGYTSSELYTVTGTSAYHFREGHGWQATYIPTQLPRDDRKNIHSAGFVSPSAEDTYFLGYTQDLYRRRGGGRWEEIDITISAQAEACSSSIQKIFDPQLNAPMRAVGSFQGTVFIVAGSCQSLVAVNTLDGHCTALFHTEGFDATLTSAQWQDIAISPGGQIALSGYSGWVKVGRVGRWRD